MLTFLFLLLSFVGILIIIGLVYLIIKKPKKVLKPKILTKYKLNKNGSLLSGSENIMIPVFSVFSKRKETKNKLYFLSPSVKTRSMGHTLTIGGTGRGKTTKLIETSIYFNAQISGEKNKPCMVIPDPNTGNSESLYEKYAPYLLSKGYYVKLLNLDTENIDLSEEKIQSDFYNPMLQIWQSQNNKDLLFKQVEFFSGSILPSITNSNESSHWSDSARNIINGFIMYMIESGDYNKNNFNIANLSELLQKHFKAVAILLKNKEKYPKANTYTRLTFESLYADKKYQISKELASILSTLNSSVHILRRPLLHILTSQNTIDFKNMAEENKPTAIFIKSKFDSSDTSGLSLISVFMQDLASYWMKKIGRRPLMFLMDEFNSFPTIERLTYFLEQGRKYNLWFLLFVQSWKNVTEKYKSRGGLSLSNFYTKIVLGTEEKQDIEMILQNYRKETKKTSHSSSNMGNMSTSQSESEAESVLTSDIKTLMGGEAFVVMRGIEPVKVNLDPINKLDIKFYNFEKPNNMSTVPQEDLFAGEQVRRATQKMKDKIIYEEYEVKKEANDLTKRRKFESFKSQIIKAFSLYYKNENKTNFKQLVVDKIDFSSFMNGTAKENLPVWEMIRDEVLNIVALNDDSEEKEDKKKEVDEIVKNIKKQLLIIAKKEGNPEIENLFI